MYDEIVRRIKDQFPYGVELCHVAYDDSLTVEQAEWYVTGDMEQLFDSILEWECENRWYGEDWYIGELVSHMRKEFPNFEPSAEWEDNVRDVLMDLDESDLLGDLVKNTCTGVIMGKWVIDEDSAEWGKHSVDELIKALGVPDTAENRAVADYLIANAPTDLGMAFAAYEVSPADLHGLNVDRAAIRSRWLPVCYGNPFTGGYWAGSFDMGATATIPLSELRLVNRMMAYGPTEVYGEFPYELECETEFVEIDT